MKKHFYILIISICIIGCSSGKTLSLQENDLAQLGLLGNVKSIESELFNLIPEKDTFRIGEKINSISIDRNELMKFNEKGNITSSKEFLSNGEISAATEYNYDTKSRLIHRREIDHYGKGSFFDYNFSFNSADSVVETVVSNQQFERKYQINRDDKNRIIENKVFQNDTIIAIYTRSYDDNGNIIEGNEYQKENVPVKIMGRTFDKRDLKQTEQITEYNEWDTISYHIKYSYDTDLNLVEENEYQSDTLSMKTVNRYHKNGKLKETQNIPIGGQFTIVTTRKFNETEDLIEHSRMAVDNSNSDIWSYKYKYDSNGNWIEKVELKNDKPLKVVKRSIEYYQ